MFRWITLFISVLIFFNTAVIDAETNHERVVNITGGGLCPNSAASLVKEEVAKLRPGEVLILIIEVENKDLITSAIKLEKLPVYFEEKTVNDLSRISIRLK